MQRGATRSLMKIGKATVPRTSICTSDEHTIVIRGRDLSKDLIGKISFVEHFFLLLVGRMPSPGELAVVNATLVAIAEHGMVPSVQASRMTFAAAPEALQGAVAAGILGCGSVVLGSSEAAGRLFAAIADSMDGGADISQAAKDTIEEYRGQKRQIPGYGHPLHKQADPRVKRLFEVAGMAGGTGRFLAIAQEVETLLPGLTGKHLALNVS